VGSLHTPTHIFPDRKLALTPLLAQLIAMVNDLASSVTFLTAQVEILTSTQEVYWATPSTPTTSNLETALKDLCSQVATVSSHWATWAAPLAPQLPHPAPTPPAKPTQQKIKLITGLASHTVTALDLPLLVEEKWYGNHKT